MRRWLACTLAAAPIPTPIGFGPRYQLAAGPQHATRLACSHTDAAREQAHVELIANKLVLLLPKGIGVARGCAYPGLMTAPSRVFAYVPASEPTLGDLFDM